LAAAFARVHFERDSDHLSPGGRLAAAEVASLLLRWPRAWVRLRPEGPFLGFPPDPYARADALVQFLLRHGVAANRLLRAPGPTRESDVRSVYCGDAESAGDARVWVLIGIERSG